jgi:hypothetical protein
MEVASATLTNNHCWAQLDIALNSSVNLFWACCSTVCSLPLYKTTLRLPATATLFTAAAIICPIRQFTIDRALVIVAHKVFLNSWARPAAMLRRNDDIALLWDKTSTAGL